MRDQWEMRGVLGEAKASVRPLLRGSLWMEAGWWKSWDLLGSALLIWGWMGRRELCARAGLQSHVLVQVSETKAEEPVVDWEHPSVCGR